jgi:5-carboxymethyl-2-hydroxymuconate isomerase
MPHLVILYTPSLDAQTDMTALCLARADTKLAAKDDAGHAVFFTGGVRVLAYPAAHHAVADGAHDCGYIYLKLRMAHGAWPRQRRATACGRGARRHGTCARERSIWWGHATCRIEGVSAAICGYQRWKSARSCPSSTRTRTCSRSCAD